MDQSVTFRKRVYILKQFPLVKKKSGTSELENIMISSFEFFVTFDWFHISRGLGFLF